MFFCLITQNFLLSSASLSQCISDSHCNVLGIPFWLYHLPWKRGIIIGLWFMACYWKAPFLSFKMPSLIMCLESPLAIKRLLGGFQELWTPQDAAVTTHSHTQYFPVEVTQVTNPTLTISSSIATLSFSYRARGTLSNPGIAWQSRPSLGNHSDITSLKSPKPSWKFTQV